MSTRKKIKWMILKLLGLHNIYVRKILRWDTNAIEKEIPFGLNPNKKGSWNEEPLLSSAIKERKTEVAELLLKHGADPNRHDDLKQTPLFYAIQNGDVEAVRLLADSGADLGFENNIGLAPLGWCLVEFTGNKRDGKSEACIRNLDCAQILLAHGANPNTFSKRIDESPFLMAAHSESYDFFKLYVKHGADPFLENKSGISPAKIVRERKLSDFNNLLT